MDQIQTEATARSLGDIHSDIEAHYTRAAETSSPVNHLHLLGLHREFSAAVVVMLGAQAAPDAQAAPAAGSDTVAAS